MNFEQGNGNQVIDLFGFLRRRGKFVAIVSGAIILLTFWVTMATMVGSLTPAIAISAMFFMYSSNLLLASSILFVPFS